MWLKPVLKVEDIFKPIVFFPATNYIYAQKSNGYLLLSYFQHHRKESECVIIVI